MVWNEATFQNSKSKSVGHNYRAPCCLLLENGATRKWHTLITRGSSLPYCEARTLGTGRNQSVVPLRLFAGNSTNQEQRSALDTVGFLGVTGFDVMDSTSFTLHVDIDQRGILTLTAVDDQTGESLLLGPSHKTTLVRKIFEPTYKTAK